MNAMDDFSVSVILPAAGAGTRFASGSTGSSFSSGISKIELQLAGKPIFLHAVEAFIRRQDVGQVIVAVSPDKLDDFKFRWGDKLGFLGVKVVAGGETERWETVLRSLEAVSEQATHVAVHDAARPLVSSTLIDRVFDAARRFPAVIPACDVGATLKRVELDDSPTQQDPLGAILGLSDSASSETRRVVETVDRRNLVAVQTPQVFEVSLFRQAYRKLAEGDINPAGVTDDAQLIEALGETVRVVPGEPANLKLTVPGDKELIEALLAKRQESQAAELAKKRLFGDEDD
ncbi:MAG: 2-C-methyl-D-erythritol 4-phosphate cytidylyltransferase [Phycisphaeraceae bacterium]